MSQGIQGTQAAYRPHLEVKETKRPIAVATPPAKKLGAVAVAVPAPVPTAPMKKAMVATPAVAVPAPVPTAPAKKAMVVTPKPAVPAKQAVVTPGLGLTPLPASKPVAIGGLAPKPVAKPKVKAVPVSAVAPAAVAPSAPATTVVTPRPKAVPKPAPKPVIAAPPAVVETKRSQPIVVTGPQTVSQTGSQTMSQTASETKTAVIEAERKVKLEVKQPKPQPKRQTAAATSHAPKPRDLAKPREVKLVNSGAVCSKSFNRNGQAYNVECDRMFKAPIDTIAVGTGETVNFWFNTTNLQVAGPVTLLFQFGRVLQHDKTTGQDTDITPTF